MEPETPQATRFQRLREAIAAFSRTCHESEPLLAAPKIFQLALVDCQAAAELGDAETLVSAVREGMQYFTWHANKDGSPMERTPALSGAWGRFLAAYGQVLDEQSQMLAPTVQTSTGNGYTLFSVPLAPR
jgi:hypothetical protein